MVEELSAREGTAARLLVKGISNKEIARALGIEVVTVKKHVGNVRANSVRGTGRRQRWLLTQQDGFAVAHEEVAATAATDVSL